MAVSPKRKTRSCRGEASKPAAKQKSSLSVQVGRGDFFSLQKIVCNKSCTVGLLSVVVWCQLVPGPVALTGLCSADGRERGWWLATAQDMASFVHGPPSLKRVMLSVLNGQRFSLCAGSEQRGKVSQQVA